MIVSIMNGQEETEISLQKVTQLFGTNIIQKSFILKSLCKFFSAERYQVYEEKYIENVHIDKELVGRNYFDVIKVSNREDLLNELKMKKSTLVNSCISNIINGFDTQVIMEKLDDYLTEIYNSINQKLGEEIKGVYIDYSMEDILQIISKSEVKALEEEYIERLDNYKLIKVFFELLRSDLTHNPRKILVVVEDIDHMLRKIEYTEFISMATELGNDFDTYTMCTTSIDGYIKIDEVLCKGINIVNDLVYNLPDVEDVVQFIKHNYPIALEPSSKQVIEWMSQIANDIGKIDEKKSLKANVLLKLINGSLCIHETCLDTLSGPENSFMME